MPALLVNENFPAPSTRLLREAGIDVLSIGESHQGIADTQVLALARRTQRWLVTFDTDYADLLFRQRLAPPPSVLLLRVPHYLAVEPASWVVPLVQNPAEYEGLFCVVLRDRVRKRPFLRLTGDGPDACPDPLPLSALQHWAYCPRQCGLIHLEQAFDDNLHTQRGQAVHALADKPGVEERKGLRIERALPLWNDALGLIGKADVVEFEPDGTPYPVEYKHGSRHKAADIAACDDVQLAAQALCLEAMTGRAVSEGALYYASSRRRRTVPITDALRAQVVEIATAVRAMLATAKLPPPTLDVRRCKGCSLRERCQPEAMARLQGADFSRSPFDPDA